MAETGDFFGKTGPKMILKPFFFWTFSLGTGICVFNLRFFCANFLLIAHTFLGGPLSLGRDARKHAQLVFFSFSRHGAVGSAGRVLRINRWMSQVLCSYSI